MMRCVKNWGGGLQGGGAAFANMALAVWWSHMVAKKTVVSEVNLQALFNSYICKVPTKHFLWPSAIIFYSRALSLLLFHWQASFFFSSQAASLMWEDVGQREITVEAQKHCLALGWKKKKKKVKYSSLPMIFDFWFLVLGKTTTRSKSRGWRAKATAFILTAVLEMICAKMLEMSHILFSFFFFKHPHQVL